MSKLATKDDVDDDVAVNYMHREPKFAFAESCVNRNIDPLDRYTNCMISNSVYSKFNIYLDLLSNNDPKIKEGIRQSEIDKVFLTGITHCMQDLHTTTSTSSILYDGKPARRDIIEKLARIIHELENFTDYPCFKEQQIIQTIQNHVGKDSRTQKKFFECVKDYSTKNYQNGTYNIKHLVSLIPPRLMQLLE